jgi:hypothetical protein
MDLININKLFILASLYTCYDMFNATCTIKVRGIFSLRKVTNVGFYYLFNCYMFRSYDHLEVEIYSLEITLLASDPLFLEY